MKPVFLVGFMGSGKTEVGRLVAAGMQREFRDTDDLVEQREGRTIEEIFREPGEGRFRMLEWEVLLSLAGSGFVVAAGGGLPESARARKWLSHNGVTVWLDVPLETAVERVGDGTGRPLWEPGDPVSFRAFFERRRALYALARHRVVASGGTPSEVAERILGVFR